MKGVQPNLHTCYVIWFSNSPSIELDMDLQLFKQGKQMHGLRYMKLVGDGDSAVLAMLKQKHLNLGSAH